MASDAESVLPSATEPTVCDAGARKSSSQPIPKKKRPKATTPKASPPSGAGGCGDGNPANDPAKYDRGDTRTGEEISADLVVAAAARKSQWTARLNSQQAHKRRQWLLKLYAVTLGDASQDVRMRVAAKAIDEVACELFPHEIAAFGLEVVRADLLAATREVLELRRAAAEKAACERRRADATSRARAPSIGDASAAASRKRKAAAPSGGGGGGGEGQPTPAPSRKKKKQQKRAHARSRKRAAIRKAKKRATATATA